MNADERSGPHHAKDQAHSLIQHVTIHFMCYCRSSGCRVLTRHLSVTDAVGKRREIVVPGKAKPKEKEKKKKEKPQGSISSRGLRNINYP